MRMLILALCFLSSAGAYAQMSVQESDGVNKLRFIGKTWNTNFFSLASTETDKLGEGSGRLSTYNYLTFATYVGNSYRLGLRLPFQYNTAGQDRFNGEKQNESELFLQDIILSLQKYDLAYLPWDLGLYWEGRIYLPTSQNSIDSKMITRLRNDFILSKVFTKYFEMEYVNKFNYYVQSRTTYPNSFEDSDGFRVSTISSTKRIFLDHWLQAWGKVTPEIGLGWKIGGEDTYWNESDAENKHKPGERKWKTGPSVRFPLTDNANFILSYDDVVDRENAKDLGKFQATNTQFTLLSFVRF